MVLIKCGDVYVYISQQHDKLCVSLSHDVILQAIKTIASAKNCTGIKSNKTL